MIETIIFSYVEEELKQARKYYPTNKHRVMAMNEEVGEFNKSILDFEEGKCKNVDIYSEGIQAIAMIVRVMTEGDDNFKFKKVETRDLV